jgi:hypothetical protein
MKSQGKRRQRKSDGGHPTPPQVTDDDSQPRHAIELRDQRQCLIMVEMMKELRTEHDVDAGIGEGERDGITPDSVIDAMPRGPEKCKRPIHADGVQGNPTATRDLPRTPGKIRETSSDVEQRDRGARSDLRVLRELLEERSQGEYHRPPAAEENVGPLDIPVGTFANGRIDAGIVEDLAAGVPHRSSCA